MSISLAACTESKSSGDMQPEEEVTDTTEMMITKIKQCSKLHTAEVHVHKIVTHSDQNTIKGKVLGQPISIDMPFGKRRIAIPIDVTLKAYIDFSQFTDKNIIRNKERIQITLPDPKVQITASKIDHENIKKQEPLLRSDFSDDEITNYERQGRKQIEDNILKTGIIEMARDNASKMLIPMFEQMGFKEENIMITFRKEFTPNDLSRIIDNSLEK